MNLPAEVSFYFFNHNLPGDPEFDLFNINTGLFALKINDPLVMYVVEQWGKLYSDIYNKDRYNAARKWGDIINDQESLQLILRGLGGEVFKRISRQAHLYDCFVHSFGRMEEDPSSADISSRIQRIISAGESAYL